MNSSRSLLLVNLESAAAVIISELSRWTLWKARMAADTKRQNRAYSNEGKNGSLVDIEFWIWKSADNLVEDILGIYKKDKVLANINWLVENGYLLKRSNPRLRYDRVPQYKVVIKAIQDAINKTPDRLVNLSEEIYTRDEYGTPVSSLPETESSENSHSENPKSLTGKTVINDGKIHEQYHKKQEQETLTTFSEKTFFADEGVNKATIDRTVPVVITSEKIETEAAAPKISFTITPGKKSALQPKKQDENAPISRPSARKTKESVNAVENANLTVENASYEDWLVAVLEQFGHRHLYRSKADLKSPALGQYAKVAKDLFAIATAYTEIKPDHHVTPDILQDFWGGLDRKGWLFTKKKLSTDMTGPGAMTKYLLDYLQGHDSPFLKQERQKETVAKLSQFDLYDPLAEAMNDL